MSPRILGLDLSLTRTGIALPDGTTDILKPPNGCRGTDRLVYIREIVLSASGAFRDTPPVDLVAIEGFSFGAKNQRSIHEIGGNGWVVRVALHEAGIPFVEIPPATLKKYATGRGNADKQAMQMAATKRLGYHSDRPDDNEVDALWLRAMAMDAYGHPVAQLPADQRLVLGTVQWPTIADVADAVGEPSAARAGTGGSATPQESLAL